MQAFASKFGVTESTRILDVGGTPANWLLLDVRPRVTLLNMPRAREEAWPGFEQVSDGCQLPFCDRSYDVVFSNSVIEHVGSSADQRRFADEVRRVGERYWVQTPNRWFPIEPHLLTPFLHYLPRAMQGALAHRWTVWDAFERPSPDRRAFYIEHYLNNIRLLAASEMSTLFPEARILRERTLGLTKSVIAIGGV
jgi:SAM-dependent methyltransferase